MSIWSSLLRPWHYILEHRSLGKSLQVHASMKELTCNHNGLIKLTVNAVQYVVLVLSWEEAVRKSTWRALQPSWESAGLNHDVLTVRPSQHPWGSALHKLIEILILSTQASNFLWLSLENEATVLTMITFSVERFKLVRQKRCELRKTDWIIDWLWTGCWLWMQWLCHRLTIPEFCLSLSWGNSYWYFSTIFSVAVGHKVV